MWEKLWNLYNTNGVFHAFVTAVIFAVVGTIGTYQGGVPTTKQAWVALGLAVAGAVWAAIQRWAQTQVASKGLKMGTKAMQAPK